MNINREKFREITKDRKTLETFLTLYGLEVVRQTAKEYGAVVALSLRDELDFGQKRSVRFLEGVNERFGDIKAGRLSIEDIIETLGDEIGLIIN